MNGVTKFYISVVILLLVWFIYSDIPVIKVFILGPLIFTYITGCVAEHVDRREGKDTGQLKYWSVIYWMGEFHKWLNKIDD